MSRDSTGGINVKRDTSFAFSFWIKPSSISGTARYIVYKGNGSTTDATHEYRAYTSNNHIVLKLADHSRSTGIAGLTTLEFQGDNLLTAATWTHIAIVYDASTRKATFYKDGGTLAGGSQQEKSAYAGTASYGEMSDLGGSLRIGNGNINTNGLNARLASFIIFNSKLLSQQPLTAQAVRGLYNGGSPFDPTFVNTVGRIPGASDIACYFSLASTAGTDGQGNSLTLTDGGAGVTQVSDSGLKTRTDNDFTIAFWLEKLL